MKKKVKSMLLGVMSGAMLIVVILSISSGSVYAQNSISNCEELQNMQSNGNYYLTGDIDCSGLNSGAGFVPIGTSYDLSLFTGTFDGQEHKITGLFINRPYRNYFGLFGSLGMIVNLHYSTPLVTYDF